MKLVINIDCPPGFPRPSDVAESIGMKWSSKRFDNKKPEEDAFDNTSRLFGNWVFEKEVKSKEEGLEEGKTLFGKLVPLYPGTIRYADYDVGG